MPTPLRVLLTGASGLVGRVIYREALPGFESFCVRNQSDCGPLRAGDQVRVADLGVPGAARRLVEQAQPAAIVHAAAQSSLGRCASRPEQTARLNVDATIELARAARAVGAQFLFFSTDQVFDGEEAPYGEADPPRPLSAYGAQKHAAEQAIEAVGGLTLVLRLPLMLGLSPRRNQGAVDMVRPDPAHAVTPLFEDEWRTPLSTLDLARLVRALLERRLGGGVLHAGGRERVQRFELGRRICAAFGWPSDRLAPSSRRAMSYPRPRDVSLSDERLRRLGLPEPRPLDEALAELARSERP